MDDFEIEYDFSQICRTCGGFGDLRPLFQTEDSLQNLPEQIMECTSIQIFENDGLPSNICCDCIVQVKQAFAFKKRCEKVQVMFITTGESKIDIKEEILEPTEEPTLSISEKETTEPTEDPIPSMPENETTEQPEEHTPSIPETTEQPEDPTPSIPEKETTEQREVLQKKRIIQKSRLKNCEICGRPVGSNNYATHLTTHSNEAQENETTEQPGPKKHYQKRRIKNCEICGRPLRSNSYGTHLKTHSNEKQFVCTTCGKSFSIRTNLVRHIRIHTGEKPYQCDHCGSSYNQQSSLVSHLRVHTPKELRPPTKRQRYRKSIKPIRRKVKCDICDKEITSTNLKVHRLTHEEKKEVLCSDCGKSFSSKASLRFHTRKIHSDCPIVKKYSCDICSKEFSNRTFLNQHMRKHTGERPYECKVCHKKFTQAAHLYTHSWLHQGKKRFECHICGKKFTLNGNLTVHIRTHTGETPYHCPICDKGFYSSSTMKKHYSKHPSSNNGEL